MVFDIRGRRRHVVKVVYAILAFLMAASLFLVTGAININSIFGSASSGESATSSFEKQAENIEAKLAKSPGDEDLLASLTRTRINVANTMITNGVSGQSGVEEVKQQLAQASEDWSEYVKAANEPAAGLAIQVAPALFQLAELSTSGGEALENVKAGVEAQEIVAKARPSLNSWSTLAFYTLFAQNYKAAEKAKEEAAKFANTKFERESFENKYEEVEKNAKEFGKQLQAEKAAKSKSSSAGKESLEHPLQGLGGTTLGG
ncbi:MAG: hypothetical protein JSS68_18325 [Actinobacteria bacterium]|nr:hypothetical protein [Actinomycetota bacterium]